MSTRDSWSLSKKKKAGNTPLDARNVATPLAKTISTNFIPNAQLEGKITHINCFDDCKYV